jgi:diguanylate cyclase (GGDEF)-like protein
VSARRELVAVSGIAPAAGVITAMAVTDGIAVAAVAGAVAASVSAGVWWYRRRSAPAALETARDDLTGLAVRASLAADVESFLETRKHDDAELTLHLFDLVGFKKYNDAFGFAAGDALLRHLSRRLAAAVGHRARVYRLRGAQFALVNSGPVGERNPLRTQAAEYLREAGEGFLIECAAATVVIPRQARNLSGALKLADHELQAERAALRRKGIDEAAIAPTGSPGRLAGSPYDVVPLAEAVGHYLGLDHDEIEIVHRSITWRDVGMMAIPEAIRSSTQALTEDQWRFVRLHPLIGERLLRSNFGLHRVAGIVRSSHERWDGDGYPDGLRGHDIPIVARIVFVCSAFQDMTSPRAHRPPLSAAQALDELRRNAGGQFDPQVVAAFAGAFAESGAQGAASVN